MNFLAKLKISKRVLGSIAAAALLSLSIGQISTASNATAPSISVTKINGVNSPFNFTCNTNPLFNPVSIQGNGAGSAPPGDASQYHVQVDWGDGVQTNGLGTFTPNSGHVNFTFTFSAGPHTYATSGSFTITARLYHASPPGNDNQADSIASIPVCISAPTPATLHVIKHVVNTGGGTATASSFSLHVKTGGTDVSGSPAAGAESPGTAYTLAAGTYVVSEGAVANYTAAFSGDCNSSGSVTLASGNSKTCTLTNTFVPPHVPSTDLSLTKVASNTTANEGDTVSYTLTIKNNGPDASTGSSVTDTLPLGLSFASATPSQGSFNSGTWTVGVLANGASATLTIVTTVNVGAGGSTISNTASISASNENDPNSANNSATAIFSVNVPTPPSINLALTKTASESTAKPGDAVTYTLTISNSGPNDASGVAVSDSLPAGLTFTSATPSQGSFNSGTWTVGALANGASATMTINVTVNANATGTITNVATASANETDSDSTNNSGSASLSVTPNSTDLSITKSADVSSANEGDTVHYTLTVHNNGPDASTGSTVTDTLPGGVSFVSSTGVGSYNSGTGVWTVPGLASGADAALTITVTVNAGTAGSTISNSATISASNENDPTSTNNASTASFSVNTKAGGGGGGGGGGISTGTLIVKKIVVNSLDQSVQASVFSVHVMQNSADISGSPQAGDSTNGNTYGNIPVGNYDISETGPSGYTQSFDSGCPNGVATVVANTTTTCTMTNTWDLVITNEQINEPGTDTATITWTTNHPATSRVVYDTVSHSDNALGQAPNYGYAASTTEDSTLVINHSVVITGLTPGTAYFLRAVSHGSPEITGPELTFTTGGGTGGGGGGGGGGGTGGSGPFFGSTPTAPNTPTPPPPQVLGATITAPASLPRTGAPASEILLVLLVGAIPFLPVRKLKTLLVKVQK